MAENLIIKTKKKLVTETTIDVANIIYKDVVAKLEAVADSENNFYIEALESIEDNPRIFKDFIYFALKEIFNCRELELLEKSSPDSRNYLIAYKKLHNFYRMTLTATDLESNHKTYNEMVCLIFEYLSKGFVEMVNPELVEDTKNNSVNPKKLYEDYNSISELFV